MEKDSMEEMNRSVFSQRLKERRRKLGIKQEGLAKSLKIDSAQIARYENTQFDKGLPLLPTCVKLAKELKCSLDWLCGLSDKEEIESDEATLFNLIADMLEDDDEITDFCAGEVNGKIAIVLNNGLFEEFRDEYKDAIDFENMVIDKFGVGTDHVNKAAELKEGVLKKYIQKYVELKKEPCE